MKKISAYAAGALVLQLVNNEILSWLVIAVAAAVLITKHFPDLMEGTK